MNYLKRLLKGILLKCLSESEAYLEIFNIYSGLCGVHQEGYKVKWILFQQGVYWPTILKDYIEFSITIQDCKKNAGVQHFPASELHSIAKPWPFRGWALDLIGEIHPSLSKRHMYILVGMNYFTK